MNPNDEKTLVPKRQFYWAMKRMYSENSEVQYRMYESLTRKQRTIDRIRSSMIMLEIRWSWGWNSDLYHYIVCREAHWKRFMKIMEWKDVNMWYIEWYWSGEWKLESGDCKIHRVIVDSKLKKNADFFEWIESEVSDLEDREDRNFCFAFIDNYVRKNPLDIK